MYFSRKSTNFGDRELNRQSLGSVTFQPCHLTYVVSVSEFPHLEMEIAMPGL